MGKKLGGVGCALFSGASWVPSNTVAWAEAYLRAKCHLDPSSRSVTMNMGRKFGGLRPLFGEGGLDTTWAEAEIDTKWHLDASSRLATVDMGGKVVEGAAVPLSDGEAGSHPSNTMWPGLRPTSVPSGILIHPAAFGHNTPTLQDRHKHM